MDLFTVTKSLYDCVFVGIADLVRNLKNGIWIMGLVIMLENVWIKENNSNSCECTPTISILFTHKNPGYQKHNTQTVKGFSQNPSVSVLSKVNWLTEVLELREIRSSSRPNDGASLLPRLCSLSASNLRWASSRARATIDITTCCLLSSRALRLLNWYTLVKGMVVH